jgi:hypothetical protein
LRDPLLRPAGPTFVNLDNLNRIKADTAAELARALEVTPGKFPLGAGLEAAYRSNCEPH